MTPAMFQGWDVSKRHPVPSPSPKNVLDHDWLRKDGLMGRAGMTFSFSGQVGFKGIHWVWMAVGAVAYLRWVNDPSATVAEGLPPACPTSDYVAHWLVYYIDFVRTFPWTCLLLNPAAIF